MSLVFKPLSESSKFSSNYKAYKRYILTDVNYSSSFGVSILRGISDNGTITEVSKSIGNTIGFDTSLLTGSGASTPFLNSIPQKIIWNSINSLFYKFDGRLLYPTCSVISIPNNYIGEGIKVGSVFIEDKSLTGTTISLLESKQTNQFGYLYDNSIDTQNMVSDKYLLSYLGFQNGIVGKSYTNTSDSSNRTNVIKGNGLIVTSGINVTGNVSSSSGYGVDMLQNSSLSIRHKNDFRWLNNNTEWGVSMWVKLPNSQSYTDFSENILISKRYQYYDISSDSYKYTLNGTPIYPFELSVINQESPYNGKLKLKVSNGITVGSVTSSNLYNDGEWHNIIINNSSNGYELFVDNVYEGSILDFTSSRTNTQNDYDITIGCYNENVNSGTSASFDEIRLYNTSLSSDNMESLSNNHYISGSAYQTNKVGMVFYYNGIIVVSDPRPKYQNVFLGNGDWDYSSDRGFTFNYRSTKTITELSYFVDINRADYNISSNPSLRIIEDINSNELLPFTTGSEFSPYFTQVGLYNDEGELLIVGKMGSPIKKPNDVDFTINVRLDLD